MLNYTQHGDHVCNRTVSASIGRYCNWRFFVVLIFVGMLVACSQRSQPTVKYVGSAGEFLGDVLCNPSGNIAVCFFIDASFQAGDGDEARRETARALNPDIS